MPMYTLCSNINKVDNVSKKKPVISDFCRVAFGLLRLFYEILIA